jgi:hypothetical protein
VHDAPAAQAVRSSLAIIASRPNALTESDIALLRKRVYAAVDELKSVGWSIERIIVRMKTVCAEEGVHPASAWHARAQTSIIDHAVRWCIERYYADQRD